MSNKPKNIKRNKEYHTNKGEKPHTTILNQTKKKGLNHTGSKPMRVLKYIRGLF